MVQEVISLYDEGKTILWVESEYSEFEVKVGVNVHRRSVLSSLIFAIVPNAIIENTIRGVINEGLYTDDFVLMNEQNYGEFKKQVSELEKST